MRREENFERFEQARRLARSLQHLVNLFFMSIRHRGYDGVLVLKIAVDQTDADACLGANIVHAGLMESSLGKAYHGGIKDLSSPLETVL